MEFSGRLTSFPIAELLQWALNDRRTGCLVLRRTSREKRVYFDEGRIVACLSDQPAEFFGQHLLLEGYLDQETLLQCLVRCRQENKRLGVGLEESGAMSLEEVKRSLKEHIEDLICDIFLWRQGIFFFRGEAPPREEILAEPIRALEIALEGARWSDEYTRIRDALKHDDIVLRRRGESRGQASLGPRKRRIFDEIDGERTLRAIYSRVQGSYFRFMHAAWEMHQEGVIEIAEVQPHETLASMELSIHDVLFEQAAVEQARSVKRRFLAPIDILENFVPVWVRRPPREEWDALPQLARDFYTRFDGTARLSAILNRSEESWDREIDFLLAQFSTGNLALLPAPLAELEAEAEQRGTAEDERWWKKLFEKA